MPEPLREGNGEMPIEKDCGYAPQYFNISLPIEDGLPNPIGH